MANDLMPYNKTKPRVVILGSITCNLTKNLKNLVLFILMLDLIFESIYLLMV